MKKLLQNKSFDFGFVFGFVLFGLINYLTYTKSYNDLINPPISGIRFSLGYYKIGFPFSFYTAVFGNPNWDYFDWLGLITDIFIAVIFSFFLGLLFKFAWSKISSRRLR